MKHGLLLLVAACTTISCKSSSGLRADYFSRANRYAQEGKAEQALQSVIGINETLYFANHQRMDDVFAAEIYGARKRLREAVGNLIDSVIASDKSKPEKIQQLHAIWQTFWRQDNAVINLSDGDEPSKLFDALAKFRRSMLDDVTLLQQNQQPSVLVARAAHVAKSALLVSNPKEPSKVDTDNLEAQKAFDIIFKQEADKLVTFSLKNGAPLGPLDDYFHNQIANQLNGREPQPIHAAVRFAQFDLQADGCKGLEDWRPTNTVDGTAPLKLSVRLSQCSLQVDESTEQRTNSWTVRTYTPITRTVKDTVVTGGDPIYESRRTCARWEQRRSSYMGETCNSIGDGKQSCSSNWGTESVCAEYKSEQVEVGRTLETRQESEREITESIGTNETRYETYTVKKVQRVATVAVELRIEGDGIDIRESKKIERIYLDESWETWSMPDRIASDTDRSALAGRSVALDAFVATHVQKAKDQLAIKLEPQVNESAIGRQYAINIALLSPAYGKKYFDMIGKPHGLDAAAVATSFYQPELAIFGSGAASATLNLAQFKVAADQESLDLVEAYLQERNNMEQRANKMDLEYVIGLGGFSLSDPATNQKESTSGALITARMWGPLRRGSQITPTLFSNWSLRLDVGVPVDGNSDAGTFRMVDASAGYAMGVRYDDSMFAATAVAGANRFDGVASIASRLAPGYYYGGGVTFRATTSSLHLQGTALYLQRTEGDPVSTRVDLLVSRRGWWGLYGLMDARSSSGDALGSDSRIFGVGIAYGVMERLGIERSDWYIK